MDQGRRGQGHAGPHHDRRRPAVRARCGVALVAAAVIIPLGCSRTLSGQDRAGDGTRPVAAPVTAPGATPDATATAAPAAPPSAPVGDAPYPSAGQTVGQGEDARIAGTDSAPATGAEVAPEVATVLEDFGRRYLSYDYRTPEATRLEGLRPLVTPELFTLLAQPMPAALLDSLSQEQRVVTAEPVSVAAIDTDIYLLTFTVRSTAGAPASLPAPGRDETRQLTVTLDGTQLVRDVR